MLELLKQWSDLDPDYCSLDRYCAGRVLSDGLSVVVFDTVALTGDSKAHIRQAVIDSARAHGWYLEHVYSPTGVEIRGYASDEAYDDMQADVYADCDSETESLLRVIVELHRISNGQQERNQLRDAHRTDQH